MKADEIANRRRALGLTQAALAEKLGVAVTTVFRWEKGIVTPSLRHARHLNDILMGLKTTLSPVDELLLSQVEPVAIFDITSIYMAANAAFLGQLGRKNRDLVGRGVADAFPDLADAVARKQGEPLESVVRRRPDAIKITVALPDPAKGFRRHRIELLAQSGFSTRYAHEIVQSRVFIP